MRPTYVAAAMMAAQTAAFEWSDVFDAFKMMAAAYSASQGFDIADYMPEITNAHHARDYIHEHGHRQIKKLTRQQRHLAEEAHHNTMARRDRLGLPKVGLAGGPRAKQSYEELASFSGTFLNML